MVLNYSMQKNSFEYCRDIYLLLSMKQIIKKPDCLSLDFKKPPWKSLDSASGKASCFSAQLPWQIQIANATESRIKDRI